MKLADVMRKERQRADLSVEQVATKLGLSEEDYATLESGVSLLEDWGPLLARIAIELETPTSRLVSETGRSAEARPRSVGHLIAGYRAQQGRSPATLARALGLDIQAYLAIERSESPLEATGLPLLRFAEAVRVPVFNLLYPRGLPASDVVDY